MSCDLLCTDTPFSFSYSSLGNPNEEKYHKYMMEYSPMQNVQKGKKYPACWLTGGLHDPRVAYWEPAKVSDWQLLL